MSLSIVPAIFHTEHNDVPVVAICQILLNGLVCPVGVSDDHGMTAINNHVLNAVADRRIQFRNCP